MAGARVAHVPEIDWLKGFSILSVVCIHAKVYDSTLVYEHLINRAVPIFLVLFGVTSELWWRRAAADGPRARLSRWYGTRSRRLVIPLWAMATGWWWAVLHFDRARALHVGWPEAFATYVGFAPWIGTSWFITVILQLVLVYPLLAFLFDRLGAFVLVTVTGIMCAECVWHVWDIVALGRSIFGNNVPEPGWYYAWIFAPRVFFDVTVGMFVARRYAGRPAPWLIAVSAALTVGGIIAARATLDGSFVAPVRAQVITYLVDAPLAVAMLGLFRLLSPLRVVTRFLGWCGLYSWGIYLGHLLVHEILHMLGFVPEALPQNLRVEYALVLFALGASLAFGADAAERVAGKMISGLVGPRATE